MSGKASVAVYMEANPSEGPTIGLLQPREEHPRHCCSQTPSTKLVLAAVAILVILAGAFLGLGLHFYLHKGESVAEQISAESRVWATDGIHESGKLSAGHMSSTVSQLWEATSPFPKADMTLWLSIVQSARGRHVACCLRKPTAQLRSCWTSTTTQTPRPD